MACQPSCAIGGHSAEANDLWMKGEVLTHRERLRQRFHFPEFNVDFVAGFLSTYQQVQDRVGKGYLGGTPYPPTS